MVFGKRPTSLVETVIAFILQLGLSGFVGILFSYLLTSINTANYYLKSTIYAYGVWFSLMGVVYLYQVQGLIDQPVNNIITEIVAITLYGLVLALLLNYLDKKHKS